MKNIEDIVPEYFIQSFRDYRKLSEEERAGFWNNRPETKDEETFAREYMKGLQQLRKAVEDLYESVVTQKT